MRITALVDSPDHVCCRYRIGAFQPFWTETYQDVALRPLPRRGISRLAFFARSRFETVILQRRLISRIELRLLRGRTRRLIYDFDDAVWMRDSFAAKGAHSDRRLSRFRSIVRVADDVIAGNEFLAQFAAEFTSADRIHIVPTCVHPDRYPISPHTSGRVGVILVWVGSASTLQGLERFAGVLNQIGIHAPGSRLKLICDQFITLPDLPVEACRWSEATEAADIASADIGIAWMPDDHWSHGKCGLKVLQYMAAGLPVVANSVGVHCEMVRHGETGLLADTPSEWIAAIKRLAGDRDLRRSLGAAGRKLVEKNYSVERGADLWQRLLRPPKLYAA